MNLKIEFLRQEISKLISQLQLPIGVVRLLLKDILHEIDLLYQHQLQQEQAAAANNSNNSLNQNEELIKWEQKKQDDAN